MEKRKSENRFQTLIRCCLSVCTTDDCERRLLQREEHERLANESVCQSAGIEHRTSLLCTCGRSELRWSWNAGGVEIGNSSFAKEDRDGFSPYRRFYLKDCERLKRLKVGSYSFRDYTVCEIENDPRLEVIEMGELHEQSNNFPYTSKLELKSHSEGMK